VGKTVPESAVVTVRVPEPELRRLDALAAKRRLTRSQLLLQALRAWLDADAERRHRALETMRERLRPALEAQDAFLDRVSVADEHRSF
jgi:predicted transcriptional regulator